MSCKALSLSTFSITCLLLLVWMTVTVRPVLSARKLVFSPGGPDKGGVTGSDSPRGPVATVGSGGGGIPSPDQSSSPLDQSSSSSTNSNYSNNCTSERRCESLPTGEVSCTTVSNCDNTSTQEQCVSETCYSTIP